MDYNYRDYPITCALIVANVAVFVVLEVLGLVSGYGLYNAGVLTPFALAQGRWYTLLTSMFMHGGILHLLCNMFTLYFVGTIIEGVFGPVRYLVVYFVSGLCGGLLSMAVAVATGNLNYGVVGASGAIFGLFGAYAYLAWREHKSPVVLLHPPTRDDLKGIFALVALNLLIGLQPGIAMEAHLGGLLGGLAVSIPLYEALRRRIQQDIDAGIEPPSTVPAAPEPYDFDAAQAAQDAAMAAQDAYWDEWESAKPAQRKDVERAAHERSKKQ